MDTGSLRYIMVDYPNIVRGFYYWPGMDPSMFCIETGKGKIIREEDGKPRFFTLNQARNYGTPFEKLDDVYYKTPPPVLASDIFNCLDEFKLTERMYIVAPGINGREHWGEVDPACFTIIVNKACEIPLQRRDLWMVADPTVYNLKRGVVPWFAEGMKTCADIACFDSGTLLTYFRDVRYTHEWGPEITNTFIEPIKNRMLGGLTISGRAVQMVYWLGAKEIVLCGVDLCGHQYFDETDRGTEAQHHTAWARVLPLFQELCDWLTARGVRVSSISPTALQVEEAQSW